jgi:MoaA/NifB/PqqE/SkfB family radical SAM enzyme
MEAGLTRIMISLDAATEATYDRMRPGSDFRLVKDNIMELLAARGRRRLPLVRLSFCLTSLNEGELEAFVGQWRDRVDFFSIQRFGNYSEQDGGLFPRLDLVPPPQGRCAQPFKRMMIRHDGQALPCCDLSGLDLALGDVRRSPLAAIWTGGAIKGLRDGLLGGRDGLRPDCRRCQDKFLPAEGA